MFLRYLVIVIVSLLSLSPALAEGDGAVADILNRERAANRLQAVQWHPLLDAAAEAHARDMARNSFMSHQGSDGSTLATRLQRAGFCYRAANENVAMGYRDVPQVMAGWFASPGHRRNALSADVTHFGFAQSGQSWVLVMGRPC